jgi:hypothetical protein
VRNCPTIVFKIDREIVLETVPEIMVEAILKIVSKMSSKLSSKLPKLAAKLKKADPEVKHDFHKTGTSEGLKIRGCQ